MTRIARWLPLVAVAATLTACGGTQPDRAAGGTAIGAGTGAAVGAIAGGVGAIPGAIIGGAVGGTTGAVTTEDEVDLGEPVWR